MLLWVDNSRRKEGHQFVQSHVSLDCWWGIQGLLYYDYNLSCSRTHLLHFFSPYTLYFHHLSSPPMSFSVLCPSPIFTYWNPTPFSKPSLKVPFYHDAFFRCPYWKCLSSMFPEHFVYFSWYLSYLYVTTLCTIILSSFNIINSFR